MNLHLLTKELFKLLNAFLSDLIKEIFSLNDSLVLNPLSAKGVKSGTSTDIFSVKKYESLRETAKKLKITNNIRISH